MRILPFAPSGRWSYFLFLLVKISNGQVELTQRLSVTHSAGENPLVVVFASPKINLDELWS